MTVLRITRGLPGSGKTTYAREWVGEDVSSRFRVNRDDLRTMADNGVWIEGVTERRIVAARDALIRELLRQQVSVIVDDTNLDSRTVGQLLALAKRSGADFELHDLTQVPLETCLARNAKRDDKFPVPEEAIRFMHARFLDGKPPLQVSLIRPVHSYVPRPDLPRAVIVDVDGTVALKGDRSPYDEDRVSEDLPNLPVIATVKALCAAGYAVIFVSGRSRDCEQATREWLLEHTGIEPLLFMRASKDRRQDAVVKLELFDEHIRDHYNVVLVLDDRDSVVRLWRDQLQLTCLQVADGNF